MTPGRGTLRMMPVRVADRMSEDMPETQRMKKVLQAYIDGLNARDAEALVALYADDATVEDPVGGPVIAGREAIAKFYAASMKVVLGARLSAPIRGSHGDAAAMAFEVDLDWDGRRCTIHVIDVMRFDADGRIRSMQACWSPDDVRPLA